MESEEVGRLLIPPSTLLKQTSSPSFSGIPFSVQTEAAACAGKQVQKRKRSEELLTGDTPNKMPKVTQLLTEIEQLKRENEQLKRQHGIVPGERNCSWLGLPFCLRLTISVRGSKNVVMLCTTEAESSHHFSCSDFTFTDHFSRFMFTFHLYVHNF